MNRFSLLSLALGSVIAVAPGPSFAAKEVVLYSFGAAPDGAAPFGALLRDAAGNLYGTTQAGGASGVGTVFRLSPPASGQTAWTETLLYSLKGGTDGNTPAGAVVSDAAGNLYGLTSSGGAFGAGAAFELMRPAAGQNVWAETVIYSFKGGTDGVSPEGALAFDRKGRLYGTTASGGAFGDSPSSNGTVFMLVPPASGQAAWAETLLHSFSASATDGGAPFAGLVFDRAGSLYGTTEFGGSGAYCVQGVAGCGTAFSLTPPPAGQTAWTERVLYNFSNVTNGLKAPLAPLVFDRSGNLYGTAGLGGASNSGAIFKLSNPGSGSAAWPETTLYSFSLNSDPAGGGLTLRGDGLHGTTPNGGTGTCPGGCGSAFKFSFATSTVSSLYNFSSSGGDGENPYSGVVFDMTGNAYGTTAAGGASGNGTVFELPR